MLTLELVYTQIPAWEGYKAKLLPQRLALLAKSASDAFDNMSRACGHRLACTDAFRSVQLQAESIASAKVNKKRLYAPLTKSGHNFGRSIDVALEQTLQAFKESGIPELVAAGQSRDALAAWMLPFGWTGISTESWHFDFREKHASVKDLIDAVYGKAFQLTDREVQMALNQLTGKKLKVDGVLGSESIKAADIVRANLGLSGSGIDAWMRRVLAGATATIKIS